ncbi:S-adenosyl-L-methionine-dependent methyltransferase [Cercophora newfieldiana]|uniref:S-adenosyl-L-methionine-dependent methyltransferase n=1 Tax=Cercophora newfieldiana TaxID=92897 RepID=A0AA39YBF0_9PEZI|nr:S-adenosyl-L-methionine-dependent methyltransferase [Cercophora newfieldiana]
MADSASPKAKPASPPKSPPKSGAPSPQPVSPSGAAPALEAGQLEAGGDDYDSVYGDVGSDTASLASSVLNYRQENGRTYHAYKAGAYFMPNDEPETGRLDLQHNLCLLTQDDRLFLSPIGKSGKPLKRVLDAGCGTGIWAIDFADENPDVSVCGVDLSPIQPAFVPPNVEFFVDDLEADWTYATPFDFIYMRLLTGSILDWPKLFGQAFNHLTPGGYIELFDTLNPLVADDDTLTEDSALLKWNRLLVEASEKLGRPLNSCKNYKKQLTAAGLINIVETQFMWPMNTWPEDHKHKNVGAWSAENFSQGVQAVSLMLFTNVLGWTKDQVEVLLVEVRKDVKNKGIHGYWPIHVVYAQKPE